MTDLVATEKRAGLGVIRMQNPPVNALGHALRSAISEAHRAFCADPSVKAIALAGNDRFFSAGADIREFDGGRKRPYLTDLIAEIEAAPKPTIAILAGVCFGGGFELALGCDLRFALPTTRLSFPEIKIGNIPGAGGTQKLPRLIGGPAALEIILSAREIGAAEAKDLGLATETPSDLAAALDLAERAANAGIPRQPMAERTVPGTPDELEATGAPFLRKSRGALAVRKAIEGVGKAYDTPLDQGLAWERETFQELNVSDEAKAQRHVFFAEREARKVPDLPRDTPERPIETAAVIGAGTMGAGIAMCFADAGIPVRLIDMDEGQLARATDRIGKTYDGSVAKGRITAEEAEARKGRVTTAPDLSAAAEADVVVEAVFEAMDLKREIFRQLDATCKPGAILATNTSTLDVDEIAAATARPGDVIGLHFFSPANIMKLLEVVRGAKTAPDVIRTAMSLGARLGKMPVLVGVCDGFAGNRMFINFNREAQLLIEHGALPWQVDTALTDWGLAMGPLSVMDLAGLDVGRRIRQARAERHGKPDLYPFTTADRLADAGRHGQKTGAGWYQYPKGARRGVPDPEVEDLIVQVSAEKGIARRAIPDDEIVHRCLWQLVNTGCQILEERIAQRASDLDVIFVHGYGFPRLRGGPMFYAEQVGLDRVLADIRRYESEVGPHWAPSALLKRAVRDGTGLDAAMQARETA